MFRPDGTPNWIIDTTTTGEIPSRPAVERTASNTQTTSGSPTLAANQTAIETTTSKPKDHQQIQKNLPGPSWGGDNQQTINQLIIDQRETNTAITELKNQFKILLDHLKIHSTM